jgi:hypothetical protein
MPMDNPIPIKNARPVIIVLSLIQFTTHSEILVKSSDSIQKTMIDSLDWMAHIIVSCLNSALF